MSPEQRATAKEYPGVLIYKLQSELAALCFPRGRIELCFQDGLTYKMSVSLFPVISPLRLRQRQQWQILDGEGFTFADSDEAFRLMQYHYIAKGR